MFIIHELFTPKFKLWDSSTNSRNSAKEVLLYHFKRTIVIQKQKTPVISTEGRNLVNPPIYQEIQIPRLRFTPLVITNLSNFRLGLN